MEFYPLLITKHTPIPECLSSSFSCLALQLGKSQTYWPCPHFSERKLQAGLVVLYFCVHKCCITLNTGHAVELTNIVITAMSSSHQWQTREWLEEMAWGNGLGGKLVTPNLHQPPKLPRINVLLNVKPGLTVQNSFKTSPLTCLLLTNQLSSSSPSFIEMLRLSIGFWMLTSISQSDHTSGRSSYFA